MRSESKRSRTRKRVRPSAIARRSESKKLIPAWAAAALGSSGLLVHAEHRQEGLLRNLHRSDALHPLLPFLLLLEQLALASDVAAVALGQHVLAHRPDRLAADDIRPDRGLDRHLEHLARDQLLELVDQRLAGAVGVGPIDDQAQRVDRL